MTRKSIILALLIIMIAIVTISSASAADEAAFDNMTGDDAIGIEAPDESTADDEAADSALEMQEGDEAIAQDGSDEALSESPTYNSYCVDVKDIEVFGFGQVTIPIDITPNPNTGYTYDFYININCGEMSYASDERVYGTALDAHVDFTNDVMCGMEPGVYTVAIYNYRDDHLMDVATLTILECNAKFSFSKTGTSYGEDNILTVKAVDSNTNRVVNDLLFYIEFSNGKYVELTTDSKGIATYRITFEPGEYSVWVDEIDSFYASFETPVFDFKIAGHKGSMTITQSGKYCGEKKVTVKLMDLVTKSPLKNREVSIMFSSGKIIRATTNSNGIATFTISLNPGTHEMKVLALYDDVEIPIVHTSVKIVKAPAKIKAKNMKTTYKSGKSFVLKVVNKINGKAIKGVKVKVTIKGGGSVTKTTDSKGQIKVSTSKLKVGSHKVTMKVVSNKMASAKAMTSKITVKKSGMRISAPKLENPFRQNDVYSVRVTNKVSGDPIKGIKVTMKVSGAKKYAAKTNSDGYASFNTKSLSKGKHKVSVSAAANKNYKSGKAKGSVKIVNKLKTRFKYDEGWRQGMGATIGGYSGYVTFSVNFNVFLLDSKGNGLVKPIKVTDSSGTKTYRTPATVSVAPGTRVTLVFAGDSRYLPCKKTITIN